MQKIEEKMKSSTGLNKKRYFKRHTCRLCDSSDVEKVIDFVATPVGDHFVSKDQLEKAQDVYALDLHFCNQCGQLQLLDGVSPEFIYKDYLYETSTSIGLVEHFQKQAQDLIERLGLKKDDLVVDLGCNDGSFLRCFHERGMKILGVEPASAIANKVKAKNINVINDFFSYELSQKIKDQYGPAKMITANNVMANVEDMDDFIKGVVSLLTDDGVFVFESGYIVDTIQNFVIDNIYHEHFCYFRLNPLVKFLKHRGLEVFEAQRVDTKGGSLRGIAQKSGGGRPISPAVNERIEMEGLSGYESAQFYKDFSLKMQAGRAELLSLIKKLKDEGENISGYGASVGVTTLIYYYGVAEYLDVLFDDNPIKQGLYSPGHHIPVVPSDEIYRRNPGYILCFPWRYRDTIIKRHVRFLKNGGHFIVPLPKVEII